MEGCNCGIFSKLFDSYNDETKRKLLNNKNDNSIPCDEILWKWDDLDLLKVTKKSLEKCVALHFAKCMYITENRMNKLSSHEMKQLVKVHTVILLPKSWQPFCYE